MISREQLAEENEMSIDFVNWFFNNKKDGCGNAWFIMMAVMWEGWKCNEQRLTDMGVQLANAESKCRELAAENVAVKECASDVMRHVYRSKTYLDSNRVVDAIQGIQCAIERKAGKTPATDTFLAEVRASGVDALVERRLTAARLAKEAGHEITARDLEDEAIRARFFAVEIRKGVQS